MVFEKLCAPALIYIFFSLTQIIMDVANGMYNTAFLKLWVSTIFTILLNYLCEKGLGIISWFIVFIPFILMTLIISMLLLIFGLDPASGKTIIKNKDNKPAPPKPIDYRLVATTSGGYFDNYNDANVNTIVRNTESRNNYMGSSSISKMMNDVSKKVSSIENDAKADYGDATNYISKEMQNIENDARRIYNGGNNANTTNGTTTSTTTSSSSNGANGTNATNNPSEMQNIENDVRSEYNKAKNYASNKMQNIENDVSSGVNDFEKDVESIF